jgi:salicylate hydroxylase
VNARTPNGSLDKPTVSLEIAIIGAGVGGLSNAIALKQAGHDVVVFEQASALSEVLYFFV